MFTLTSSLETGTVDVATTEYQGHDVEFWAERATQRIISVGGDCHPAIREQAEAFRKQVFNTIVFYMKEAIKSDRTTLSGTLEKNQQGDLAEIIRRI
mgnify:FL=1|jgi:hypothetical protein